MDIQVREARPADTDFAGALYFETMRGMIEPLFGWDQCRQEESFAGWFDLQQAGIIMADGRDVGWMQTRADEDQYKFYMRLTAGLDRLMLDGIEPGTED